MNKKAQFDFIEEISPIGIGGLIIGTIIGIIIAKRMGNALPLRIIVGLAVGIICYFVAARIGED